MILKWYDLVAVWFGSGTINHWKIHLRSNFTLSQNFHNFIKSATRTEVGLVRGDLGTAQDLRARFVLRRAVQPGKNTGEQGKHDATKANPKRQTQKRTKTNKTTGENTRTHAASTARPQSQPANRTSALVWLRISVWLRKQVWSPQRYDQKQNSEDTTRITSRNAQFTENHVDSVDQISAPQQAMLLSLGSFESSPRELTTKYANFTCSKNTFNYLSLKVGTHIWHHARFKNRSINNTDRNSVPRHATKHTLILKARQSPSQPFTASTCEH